MAKNQFLALNIQKLSGQCGKLLCCLKYEDEMYSELRKDAPKYGVKFKFEGIDYKISGVNLLAKTVKIESLDKEIIKTISFDEVNEMMKK
jgi:cell fate regulator YaaT (PSP1 superfamily)